MNVFAPVAIYGFWLLLIAGWVLDELRFKGAAVFVLLWAAGSAGFTFAGHRSLFTPYAAVLDIALVLIIFKGDVTLR
jgi:hypothetical protein